MVKLFIESNRFKAITSAIEKNTDIINFNFMQFIIDNECIKADPVTCDYFIYWNDLIEIAAAVSDIDINNF